MRMFTLQTPECAASLTLRFYPSTHFIIVVHVFIGAGLQNCHLSPRTTSLTNINYSSTDPHALQFADSISQRCTVQ